MAGQVPGTGDGMSTSLSLSMNFDLIFKMTIANITCLLMMTVVMVEKFRNYGGYFSNIKIPYRYDWQCL